MDALHIAAWFKMPAGVATRAPACWVCLHVLEECPLDKPHIRTFTACSCLAAGETSTLPNADCEAAGLWVCGEPGGLLLVQLYQDAEGAPRCPSCDAPPAQ